MNKYAMLVCMMAALGAGVGSASAQNLSAAPKMAGVKPTKTLGQPKPPPVVHCEQIGSGVYECYQEICEDVGSGLTDCVVYSYTRDGYFP